MFAAVLQGLVLQINKKCECIVATLEKHIDHPWWNSARCYSEYKLILIDAKTQYTHYVSASKFLASWAYSFYEVYVKVDSKSARLTATKLFKEMAIELYCKLRQSYIDHEGFLLTIRR